MKKIFLNVVGLICIGIIPICLFGCLVYLYGRVMILTLLLIVTLIGSTLFGMYLLEKAQGEIV